MAFYTTVFNLFRQPTKSTNLSSDKYLPFFDKNDNFPLKWHKAISESPSATSCVSTIQDFLEGIGFSDPSLESIKVNYRGEDLFQLHQQTCKDFGEFEGFYWHFMFNALGQITEWRLLPFENCRLGKPDDRGYIAKIFYNPYFGTEDFTTIRQKETICYHVFDPLAVQTQIAEEKDKFKGQVYFCGTTNALSRFYPLPEAYSAVEWMETEAAVALYHKEHVKNGLLQPYMLCPVGNPNEAENNPEDSSNKKPVTRGQMFDAVIQKSFMGAKRVGNLIVHWITTKEEAPMVVALPTNANGDTFLAMDTQATKKITIAFKVPAILANINEGVSLGGDGNTVRVAVKLMQQRVKKKQRILTDAYETVLKKWITPYNAEITISPYNPYPELEVIDQKIWDALSTEEQRDWIEKNTEIELTEIAPPAPTQARISNAIPAQFPDKIKAGIKKALEHEDRVGIKCNTRGPRRMAEAILNGQNLGLRELKRIHSFLKARQGLANSLVSDGCNAIQYHAWGGKEMELFLESELKRVDQWLNKTS